MSNAMECREFHELVAEILERTHLPLAGQMHLAECGECAAMLSDFEAIAGEVRQMLPQEAMPVPDLWPQIREVLRREGLIHGAGEACAPAGTPKLVRGTTVPRRAGDSQ